MGRQRADLLELATEAIIVRNLKGILKYWNSGAETLYGWRRNELLGKPIHEILQTKFPDGQRSAEITLADTGSWNGNLTQYTRDALEVIVACRKAQTVGGNAVLEISQVATSPAFKSSCLKRTFKKQTFRAYPPPTKFASHQSRESPIGADSITILCADDEDIPGTLRKMILQK